MGCDTLRQSAPGIYSALPISCWRLPLVSRRRKDRLYRSSPVLAQKRCNTCHGRSSRRCWSRSGSSCMRSSPCSFAVRKWPEPRSRLPDLRAYLSDGGLSVGDRRTATDADRLFLKSLQEPRSVLRRTNITGTLSYELRYENEAPAWPRQHHIVVRFR